MINRALFIIRHNFFKLKLSFEDQKNRLFIIFLFFINAFSACQEVKIIWSRRDKSLVKLRQKFGQDEMKFFFANKPKKRPRVTVITRGLTIISYY